ncbi:MAG: ArsR/SmtB family transcription factor [Actinomycetota bacterium]
MTRTDTHPVDPVERCGPQALARFFRVLGDPTRIRILEALLDGERSVSELVQIVDAPQSRVSNHLACLKWCRFAESERRGRKVFYRVSDPQVRELIRLARAMASENADYLGSCTRVGPGWV